MTFSLCAEEQPCVFLDGERIYDGRGILVWPKTGKAATANAGNDSGNDDDDGGGDGGPDEDGNESDWPDDDDQLEADIAVMIEEYEQEQKKQASAAKKSASTSQAHLTKALRVATSVREGEPKPSGKPAPTGNVPAPNLQFLTETEASRDMLVHIDFLKQLKSKGILCETKDFWETGGDDDDGPMMHSERESFLLKHIDKIIAARKQNGSKSCLKALAKQWKSHATEASDLLAWAVTQRTTTQIGGNDKKQKQCSLLLRDGWPTVVHWTLESPWGRPVTLDEQCRMIYPVPFLVDAECYSTATVVLPTCGFMRKQKSQVLA